MNSYTTSFSFVILCFGLVWNGAIWAQAKNARQSSPKEKVEMPAEIHDKVSQATVRLICDDSAEFGSGVLIGLTSQNRALILTSCHVVAKNFHEQDPDLTLDFCDRITVKLATETNPVSTGVLKEYVDRANDLALLATREPVDAVRLASYTTLGENLKPGRAVAAFGFPGTEEITQTVGTLIRLQGNYLVFDAAIAPGNSGGPLVDKHGRMIGLSTYVEGKEGYAININLVLTVVERWLGDKKLRAQWQHQKYASFWERTYKDWRVIAGEAVLIAGSLWAAGVFSGEGEFPLPPVIRPSTE